MRKDKGAVDRFDSENDDGPGYEYYVKQFYKIAHSEERVEQIFVGAQYEQAYSEDDLVPLIVDILRYLGEHNKSEISKLPAEMQEDSTRLAAALYRMRMDGLILTRSNQIWLSDQGHELLGEL